MLSYHTENYFILPIFGIYYANILLPLHTTRKLLITLIHVFANSRKFLKDNICLMSTLQYNFCSIKTVQLPIEKNHTFLECLIVDSFKAPIA